MSEGQIVDDIRVDLKRPRDEEVRASTRAVTVTKSIIRNLGLAGGVDETPEPKSSDLR